MTDAAFRRVLWLAFAASGATALAFEVVWIRRFAQLFGSTQQALASTLATFMAGLMLGALAAARWGRTTPHPLRWWAAAELFVAAWGLALPFLLAAAAPLHAAAWRATDGPALTLVRLGLCAALLLPPTTAMGATLPLLARAVGTQGARGAASLYAANVLGATLGAAATGMWLLPRLGLTTMTAATASVTVCVALLGVALSRAATPAPPLGSRRAVPWEALLAVFATGTATMALEVLASRGWALVLGAGGASYTAVLVVFLLGLGVGAGVIGRRALRAADMRAALGLCVAIAGLGVGLVLVWLPHLPPLVFTGVLATGGSMDGVAAGLVRLGSIGLLVPAVLALGAAWPLALAVADDDDATRGVGRVVAANTAGNIVGSLAAGFVMLPLLGLQNALRLLAVGLGLAALAVLGRAAASTRRGLGAFAAATAVLVATAAPTWDLRPLALGLYRVAVPMRRAAVLEGEILWHEDGASSSVTVARHQRGPNVNLTLYTNGKPDATSHLDADTQILLGLVPLLVHDGDGPLDALVVGYGSGMTAGALLASDDVGRVDVVELEPAVYEAADRFFGPVNGRPDVDPRVHRRVGDGRTVLLHADQQWDIVISEPPNPWVAGVADLFTADFYAAARERLAPGGLFAQWVQVYELRPDTVRSIWATFGSVFPDTHAFRVSGSDLLLVGGTAPWRVAPDRLARRADPPAVRALLARAGVPEPWDALARYAFGPAQLATLSAGGRIATDDGAWLDHQAWRDLLGALDDRTASQWQREIGLAIADQGQLSALLAGLPPGPSRGRTAVAVAEALVRARRWDQAGRWREMAASEGADTSRIDAAFAERGKVLVREPLPL